MNAKKNSMEEDSSFFDILSKIQSNRLDDQRCSIKESNPYKISNSLSTRSKPEHGEVIDIKKSASASTIQNDDFFSFIMKSQRSRLEDQRVSMHKTKSSTLINNKQDVLTNSNTNSNTLPLPINKQPKLNKNQAVTVPPDDEFLSLIQKFQSRRLDEQRSVIKSPTFSLKTSKSGSEMAKKFYDR